MKNTLVAAAVAIVCVAATRTTCPDVRLDELEARLDKIESRMASRDHMLMLSATWMFDRMELLYQERSGEVQNPEVAQLRAQVLDTMREGAKLASGIQHLLEQDRILLASRNYQAAVELHDDIYHRIRIFQEEVIPDGPQAAERHRRNQAWIDWFENYMKQTPDPEKVKEALSKQKGG